MSESRPSVLILGAGINGCALARELLLSGVSVVLVDNADICSGATAYASRLIHGGLRYLEYGEFDLVRESLAERTRLLRLAPQFVRPLRLYIPTGNRLGGLMSVARRFLGWDKSERPTPPRGLWMIRSGLAMYDSYARDQSLPRHSTHRVRAADAIAVDRARYRWECAYSDAQVEYPERFVFAMLEDARTIARESGCEFRVFAYHRAVRKGTTIEVQPCHASDVSQASNVVPAVHFTPAAIVNATGAWVDLTLEALQIPAPTLMAGTKGSHLFTFHEGLRRALAGRGLYAEAPDGRPVFVTPLAGTTLIGTTDIPFHGSPADAVATPEEIDYLLTAVNRIMPDIGLTTADVAFHYSGVRPLPRTDDARPAAVTRRHWLEHHPDAPIPCYSVIGGKLTTCRSLAESAAQTVIAGLRMPVTRTSSDRVIPGGAEYPANDTTLTGQLNTLAARTGFALESVRAVWSLFGTRANSLLELSQERTAELLPDTWLPCSVVRSVIRHEWVTRLDDLVERRLMLLFQPRLSTACLRRLAGLMVEEGALPGSAAEAEVAATIERIERRFGKSIAG